MKAQQRILGYIFRYARQLALLFVSSLMLALSNAASTVLVGVFLAGTTHAAVEETAFVKYVMKMGLYHPGDGLSVLMVIVSAVFVVVYSMRGVFSYINQLSVGVIAARISMEMREDMYRSLQRMPMSYFQKGKVGDYISRMNSDVQIIRTAADVIMVGVEAPLMILVGMSQLFIISWKLTVAVLVFVPVIGLILDRITYRIKKATSVQQESMSDVNAKVTENLKGIRIIKAFAREDYELERFARVNLYNYDMTVRTVKRTSLVVPVMEAVGGLAVGVLILTGSLCINAGMFDFPALGEYIMMSFIVANAVKSISRLKSTQQQILAAGDRIFEIIDMKGQETDSPGALPFPAGDAAEVELRHVTFAYEDEPVIRDLSVTFPAGRTVALVGPSGSGKSTVADLIPLFYAVTEGEILINGVNVRDISLGALREAVALVPQEVILFSGTIRDNIKYGAPDATDEEVYEAARAANAHGFITAAPKGYDTELGEGGSGLSGGQRQRIAIARALLKKKARILILDEATSALDNESESAVQSYLDHRESGVTTIIIAHRLSTVKNAHRIYVLDRGAIAEQGSFDELISAGGCFSELYSGAARGEDR
ncbi:MAG: ABC transporter ATP-binding protein [Abditibacteriota bacterium]|nr:ABC transporter ATP-binding protein [Abditibacteriota bacterium]